MLTRYKNMVAQLIYILQTPERKHAYCYGAFRSGVSLLSAKEKNYGQKPNPLNLDNLITHGEEYPLLYQCAVARL